jgi:hypothetical protein
MQRIQEVAIGQKYAEMLADAGMAIFLTIPFSKIYFLLNFFEKGDFSK